ncbi:MAG: ATP synthase F0 subunit B [Gaiellaceae bacterium]
MLTFPPDFSFVIQIVSFFILWAGLKRLLFDPVLHVLEQREERTSGTRHAADEMNSAAHAAQAEYEQRMQGVRQALSAEADATHNANQAEEQRLLSETRTQASTQLSQLRDSLRRQADEARPALANEARDLASRILERVVGRAIQ